MESQIINDSAPISDSDSEIISSSSLLAPVIDLHKLVFSTSCSLLHTAVDLVNETKLDTEIISWLAFAAQKVVEVNALAKALCGSKDEVDSENCCFDHLQEVLYLVPEVIKIVFQQFRIKEFSEWSQCIVLELVSKYVPPNSSEIFDIMNLLEDRLQHANGAVVLATIKLSRTDVHQQIHMH
ncbi:hypothetical protein POM88_027813 [Heracleum sosnowskyi]|uniref:Condensin complex subunit 1 C-terminal domain-containing protein n=1 Tax=Heracleum sosnowskyi TaxID=360622 RepID=A0AAD8I8I3_9APIA|nr:hypothetical protein POM88_027813 [Heracleum sosnowskyi]